VLLALIVSITSELTLPFKVTGVVKLFQINCILNACVSPFRMAGARQVRTLALRLHPAGAVTKVACDGILKISLAFVAACGPALLIVNV
jgi:hypothetical protein